MRGDGGNRRDRHRIARVTAVAILAAFIPMQADAAPRRNAADEPAAAAPSAPMPRPRPADAAAPADGAARKSVV